MSQVRQKTNCKSQKQPKNLVYDRTRIVSQHLYALLLMPGDRFQSRLRSLINLWYMYASGGSTHLNIMIIFMSQTKETCTSTQSDRGPFSGSDIVFNFKSLHCNNERGNSYPMSNWCVYRMHE